MSSSKINRPSTPIARNVKNNILIGPTSHHWKEASMSGCRPEVARSLFAGTSPSDVAFRRFSFQHTAQTVSLCSLTSEFSQLGTSEFALLTFLVDITKTTATPAWAGDRLITGPLRSKIYDLCQCRDPSGIGGDRSKLYTLVWAVRQQNECAMVNLFAVHSHLSLSLQIMNLNSELTLNESEDLRCHDSAHPSWFLPNLSGDFQRLDEMTRILHSFQRLLAAWSCAIFENHKIGGEPSKLLKYTEMGREGWQKRKRKKRWKLQNSTTTPSSIHL